LALIGFYVDKIIYLYYTNGIEVKKMNLQNLRLSVIAVSLMFFGACNALDVFWLGGTVCFALVMIGLAFRRKIARFLKEIRGSKFLLIFFLLYLLFEGEVFARSAQQIDFTPGDINITAYDLKENRPYARSLRGWKNE
jgi:hypothetical protein